MDLRKPARPIALLLGVGTIASLWAWASQAWLGPTLERVFIEPGSARSFRVITRADHDPSRPAPVLFALHAYATAPDVLLRGYALEALAAGGRGFVLVVPEGQRDAHGNYYWNATRACCGEGPDRPDDLGYLRGVLAEVKRRYAVDPKQVMVLGVSNGGFMAHRWACCAEGELSAIASVCGSGPGPEDHPCRPASALSVLQIHGDQDDVIRYQGGRLREADYPSARAAITPYLALAGTPTQPKTDRTHTLVFGTIRKQTWSGKTARVALWTVEGGGHHLRAAQASVLDILDFLQGR